MIAPLMYILVFGFGVQTISHGQPYLNFLIPGVVALTSMNGSFNAIAQTLNVQRLYEKAKPGFQRQDHQNDHTSRIDPAQASTNNLPFYKLP